MKSNIYQLYLELLEKHSPAVEIWPQWCATRKSPRLRELIAIGAILTRRTSWHNADLALRNLKKRRLLSLTAIADLPDLEELTKLIRPAGFYTTKPRCLFDFCAFVVHEWEDLKTLGEEEPGLVREKLLAIKGIGPETADTILLYALDKPTFVVDEYTKRLVEKRGLATKFSYNYLKELFERNLPRDVNIYQDFHALVIVEEKGKSGSVMKKV